MIKDIIGEPAVLEQLAEECTELAKAALKKARILRGENPTPVTKEKADSDIIEEYTDVVVCMSHLDMLADENIAILKNDRWVSRIRQERISHLMKHAVNLCDSLELISSLEHDSESIKFRFVRDGKSGDLSFTFVEILSISNINMLCDKFTEYVNTFLDTTLTE